MDKHLKMQKAANEANRVLYATLIVAILISILGYIFDCLYDFNNVKNDPFVLVVYLLQYLIFKSIIFLIVIVIFSLVFEIKLLDHLPLKIIAILALSYLYASFFHMDDWSITFNGEHIKLIRLTTICSLSGIAALFIDQHYFVKKINEPVLDEN